MNKNFFKSAAFKSIVTLLIIVLASGILLTVCNSLFKVSDEERFQRAISKIYGKQVTCEEQDLTGFNTSLTYAEIGTVYKVVDDGNYIVTVSGKGGYGGNVLCWIVIKTAKNGKAIEGIGNVIAQPSDNGGESFLNKISSDNYNRFSADYETGIVYEYGFKNGSTEAGSMYISTGASYTMRGISNAVNGAVQFMTAYLSGEAIVDPYEKYSFREYINMEETTWTVDGGNVIYSITTTGNGEASAFELSITVGANKTITDYTIVKSGSTGGYPTPDVTKFVNQGETFFKSVIGDDGSVTNNSNYASNGIETGATKSNYLCLYAGLFATANYDLIISEGGGSGEGGGEETDPYEQYSFREYINMELTSWTVEGASVTYAITTTGNGVADAFELSITVGEDKTITAYTVDTSGSTYGYPTPDVTKFVNQGETFFKSIIGDDGSITNNSNYASNGIETGATKSNYLCLYAGLFATANYDLIISENTETEG